MYCQARQLCDRCTSWHKAANSVHPSRLILKQRNAQNSACGTSLQAENDLDINDFVACTEYSRQSKVPKPETTESMKTSGSGSFKLPKKTLLKHLAIAVVHFTLCLPTYKRDPRTGLAANALRTCTYSPERSSIARNEPLPVARLERLASQLSWLQGIDCHEG
jgi:hypothetical protein